MGEIGRRVSHYLLSSGDHCSVISMLQSGATFSQRKLDRRPVSQKKGIYMGARVGDRGRFGLPPLPLPSQLQSTDPSNSAQHFVIMNNLQVVRAETIRILNSVSYLQKQDLAKELQVLSSYVLTVNLDLRDVKRDNMPESMLDLVSKVVVDFQPGSRDAVKEVLRLWLERNVCFIADLLYDELEHNPEGLDPKADWISQCFTAIKHLRETLKGEMAGWCREMWTIRTRYPKGGMDRSATDEAKRILRAHTWIEWTRQVEQTDADGSSRHTSARSLKPSGMSTSEIFEQISLLSAELSRRFTQSSGHSVSSQAPTSGLPGSF